MTKHFDVGAPCAHVCTCVQVCKGQHSTPSLIWNIAVPLYCVNMVPLSSITGPQCDIGTCSSVVSRPLMIQPPHKSLNMHSFETEGEAAVNIKRENSERDWEVKNGTIVYFSTAVREYHTFTMTYKWKHVTRHPNESIHVCLVCVCLCVVSYNTRNPLRARTPLFPLVKAPGNVSKQHSFFRVSREGSRFQKEKGTNGKVKRIK